MALNEADNFDIRYYKFYKGRTLKRGVISCCGYRVEMFDEEEEEEFGKYGFKLVPNDDTRRCWWFRAEDDEVKKEWEEVSPPSPPLPTSLPPYLPLIARPVDILKCLSPSSP